MHKGFMVAGSFIGAFAVALGAFGTHILKQKLNAEGLAVYQTGVQYHFYHVGAIFIVAFLWDKLYQPAILWAGKLFITGIFFFSGSLYLMTYLKAFGAADVKWLGIVTPIGGICFITGWLLLGWAVSKGKSNSKKHNIQ